MLIGPYFPRKLAFCFCPSPPHFCLAHPRRSTIRIDPWPSFDAFESGAVRDSGHQPAIPKLESSSKQLGESQSSHLIRRRPPHYPVLAEQTTFPPVISLVLTISHHRKDRVKDPVYRLVWLSEQ
jgi:hypothetical protein